MYMYYFLGHMMTRDLTALLSDDEQLNIRLQRRAQNTFLMVLDGDIDFEPSALTLFIDLMRHDPQLGAACGRIHPVGSGKQHQTTAFLFLK